MPSQPLFTITDEIRSQVAEICEQIDRLSGSDWGSRSPYLRKDNRIETIHSSLAIENNTLSLDDVAAIIDGKKVHGLKREIQEVQNAFAAYESLDSLQAHRVADFLSSHGLMLKDIKDDAGQFRARAVAIYQGDRLVHMAPPADRVRGLVESLFSWQKTTDTHPLIAGAVVHYEIEFIHPFSDGNGRMGRLWQTLVLSRWNSMLAFLPVESVIHREQKAYYSALAESDSGGSATPFITFILSAMITSLRRAEKEASSSQTDQVSDQVKRLLFALVSAPELQTTALMSQLSLKHRATFRKNYLRPALAAGWVEMTLPDSPQSPTQAYRLTASGSALARKLEHQHALKKETD